MQVISRDSNQMNVSYYDICWTRLLNNYDGSIERRTYIVCRVLTASHFVLNSLRSLFKGWRPTLHTSRDSVCCFSGLVKSYPITGTGSLSDRPCRLRGLIGARIWLDDCKCARVSVFDELDYGQAALIQPKEMDNQLFLLVAPQREDNRDTVSQCYTIEVCASATTIDNEWPDLLYSHVRTHTHKSKISVSTNKPTVLPMNVYHRQPIIFKPMRVLFRWTPAQIGDTNQKKDFR